MKYYNIVEIIGAGTGSDSYIGMYSGDLRFISSENLSYPNHYTGFISNNTISDVLSACNISQGGALGGFQGIVSVNALSADLCNSIVSGGITLIGKTIKIKVVVNHDSTEFEYQRYTGVITSWNVIDEVTVSIASDTSAAFDKKKVSGISVTKEMALNDSTNEAIGKNVTNVFGGNNVDYPAIYVSTENIPIALSMQTQSGMDLIAHKLGSYTGPKKDYCTDSGLIKGATLFGVFKKYKASEKDNVKICFSFNGKELFNVGALYYEINSMLSGMRIKIVSGSGKDKILKIVSVNRETNDSYDSIWIELSTNDIDLLTDIGGYTSSINKSIKTGEPLILDNGFYNTASTQSDHFNASYDAGTVLDSVSYFSIIGQPNIFIVHGSIDVTNGAKLVGSSQDSKTEFVADIPYDAIKTVYTSNEWKMLQIDTSGLIVDEDSSFMFMKIATNKCLIHNVGSTVKTCHVGANDVYTTSDYYENDAPTDGEEIGVDFANDYTTSYSIDDVGTYRALFNTTLFVPIEDLFNGLDLSNGNSNFGIVPKFYHEFRTTRDTLSGGLWKFYTAFNIYVVGEGNSVLSQPLRLGKIIKEYIFANSSNPSPLVQNIFRVTCEPENSRFVISENHDGTSPTTTYDYDSFNSLCSQLDLSGDLNALSSKQIRGVLVQIRSWIVGATDGGIKCNTSIVNTDLLKHIYGVYTFSSSKVSKEKIYIRAQRNNNGITVDCPASIVKRIATESGLTCDAASFGNVESTQRALYTDLANSSAQYQTSSDESISDAVDSICKQSMMAVYQRPDGKFYASWFPDDSQEIDTNWDIPNSLIIKGSASISKPNSAYLSTDFNFSIKQKQLLDATSAFVNTDASLASFPESGYRETHGTIYTNGSNGYTFTTSLTSENVVTLYITKDLGYIDLLRKFPVGTFWKITFALVASPHTELEASGVITAVAFSTSYNICVGFSCVTQAPNNDYIVKSIQLYAPNEKWLDYVSGSFISEYSIAKNMWDHAQDARLKIGVEKKMNSQLTKIEQPIWGDDSQALMNWMLYSVIYNTREKTVIRFSMPMISTVMQLSLMDAVKFQFGVYSSTGLFTNGIKGRIVEINDDYENAKVDFTMLCSVSDSDSLIIDERFADGSLLIDENNVSNDFYDEGALA